MAGMLEEQPPGRSIFLDVCVQFTIFSFHMSIDIKSELFFSPAGVSKSR